jgi:hypothetical protein
MERNSATDLAGLIGVVLALVIGLHQAGDFPGLNVDWADPIGWAAGYPRELVIGAFLRQLGLILGYWVMASTAAYAAARLGKMPVRWPRFVTLPLARRLVDRAVATSLAVSLLGSPLIPAATTEPPVVFEAFGDGIPVPHVRVINPSPADTSLSPPASDAGIAPVPELDQDVAEPTAPPVVIIASEATHIVVEGDNLWAIAAAHLSLEAGSEVGSECIAGYWRKVIDRNRTTLRSGDPNLIYPGEMIALPAIETLP